MVAVKPELILPRVLWVNTCKLLRTAWRAASTSSLSLSDIAYAHRRMRYVPFYRKYKRGEAKAEVVISPVVVQVVGNSNDSINVTRDVPPLLSIGVKI